MAPGGSEASPFGGELNSGPGGRGHRALHQVSAAIFAAVAAAVFSGETFGLGSGAEDLRPHAVFEDGHVTAFENLERPLDLLQVIKLRRASPAESFKPGGINEVA